MFQNSNKNSIQLTLSVFHNFFRKLILMRSKNFRINPNNLGIHPYFLKRLPKAANNFSIEKSIEIIHLLSQTDLKSKGVNKVELMKRTDVRSID